MSEQRTIHIPTIINKRMRLEVNRMTECEINRYITYLISMFEEVEPEYIAWSKFNNFPVIDECNVPSRVEIYQTFYANQLTKSQLLTKYVDNMYNLDRPDLKETSQISYRIPDFLEELVAGRNEKSQLTFSEYLCIVLSRRFLHSADHIVYRRSFDKKYEKDTNEYFGIISKLK